MEAKQPLNWNLNFIRNIQRRPGTWNRSIRSTTLQNKHWNELSELYDTPVDTLKRQFSNLRLGLRRQLRKIPQTNNRYDIVPEMFESKWPYYKPMLFLINDIVLVASPRKRRHGDDFEELNSTIDMDDMPVDVDKADTIIELPDNGMDKSNNNSTILNHYIEFGDESQRNPVPADDDSVYHFLMSLRSYINQLDPTRKLNVQSRIYDLVREEVTRMELH